MERIYKQATIAKVQSPSGFTLLGVPNDHEVRNNAPMPKGYALEEFYPKDKKMFSA